jgi:hypothetical protein
MAGKAHITTDFPSTNEVASRLRIPSRRAAQLQEQLRDISVNRPKRLRVVFKKRDAAKTREHRESPSFKKR